MRFVLLLLILLPFVLSIEQISDENTTLSSPSNSQNAETTNTVIENPQSSEKTEDSNPQATSIQASESSKKSQESTNQSTQINKEKASAVDQQKSATSTNTQSSQKAEQAPVYVSEDDDSSCKGQCLSGGVCKNDVCVCPPGYTGSKCEIVFDSDASVYQTQMNSIISKYYFALMIFMGLLAITVVTQCVKCGGGTDEVPSKEPPVEQDNVKYVDLDLDLEAAHHEPQIEPEEKLYEEPPVEDQPIEQPPYQEPAEQPIGQPIEQPLEEPIEQLPYEEPVEQPIEQPLEEPIEQPLYEEPVEQPIEEQPQEEPQPIEESQGEE